MTTVPLAEIGVLDAALTPGPGTLLRRRVFGHASLMIGLGILAAIFFLAFAAPLIAPHDPYDQDLARRLIPPIWHDKGTWTYPLGTDGLGRDYLSRLIYGSQISLLIGFAVMAISGIIGLLLGISAGYFGGKVDMAVTFIVTTRLSMPVVLVALAVVAIFGGSLTVVILVLGFLKWDRFVVVIRGATMQVRALDYVAAAEATGASKLRILFSEILPNIMNHLIVVATLEMASAILLEAALHAAT